MTGLKKYLLFILMLCTLGYSSAWAFDGHVMEQIETESASLSATFDCLAGADMSDQHKDTHHICDHCCHISSHLVAIFSDTSCIATVSTSIFFPNITESNLTFMVSPDLKPPRV